MPVSGIIRLLVEAPFFGSAVWSLDAAGRERWGLALAVLLILH